MHKSLITLSVLACAAALAGCASFSADGGRDRVNQLVKERGGPAPSTSRLATLLTQPMTLENAVDIALLNNRTLQAGYAELGIAEADLVQAGRLSNPSFSFGRVKGPYGVEIERTLTLPLAGLLTMPVSRTFERRHFEQTQMHTAAEVLRVASQTRQAWYGAVAAQQSVIYQEQVHSAAEASAALAKRMLEAGNWSALQQGREQAFLADAVAELARARQSSVAEREKLIRLMGLSGSQTSFTLPERLPDLPAAPRAMDDAEGQAMASRLDILMSQKELAALAASLGLTRATRFVNLLSLGFVHNNSTGQHPERMKGYEVEIEIPLFDFGGARVARAEAVYMQALQTAAAGAIDARSQVRETYALYRSAYDMARHHRDEIVPLKKRISDEQLLRYNGMLISVFELLADAREQVASVNASIQAQRDFWLADAALQDAMNGATTQH
jgi:outer membrane protein TolC